MAKTGRPPKPAEEKLSARIQTTLTVDENKALEKLVNRKNAMLLESPDWDSSKRVDIAMVVRELIRKELKKQGLI